MKKHLLSFLLLVPGLAQAQAPVPYTVKGKIGQLNAPAKIYLLRGNEVLDSATFKNGTFELKGTTDVPQSASLVIKRNGKLGTGVYGEMDVAQVFLEPGPVVLTSPELLRKATITGGPVTADNQRLQAALKPISAKMEAFGAESQKVPSEQRNSPAFAERMQAQFEAFNKEIVQRNRDFIKANPNSWVSLDALTGIGMWEVPQYAVVAPLYEAFSPALKNSPQGRQYGKMVRELKDIAIGTQAPAFSQQTPEGKTVALADYRGKYVLIDFWASWCGPCRAENPAVIKLYNEYKGRNFEILGVSVDNEKTREKWVKAIQEDHLTWPQVSDLRGMDNEVAQRYHVRAVPQNFLIDPTGKIVAANLHGEDLKATLARYIK
ncbi:TlpA disulfide reductase family protein [Hymenobacter fastidiosus]|uniref:TlpA disulfide reductase family protein n=1 Tax=Hymenobacter fastidiosus TaxID=486264 RepID=A0ABP7RCQ6_9BACT